MTAPPASGPPDSGLSLETLDQRMETASRYLPHGLLVISLALATLTPHQTWGSVWITLAVAVGAVVWTAWWVTFHPAWARRMSLMGCYYAGFLVLATVLVARSPWFAFYAFTGVLHGYEYLRGVARYTGIACTAVLTAVSQTGGFRPATPSEIAVVALVGLFDTALYVGFGLLGQKTDEQNRKRRQIIAELAEANERLEEALQEKAGLQAQLLTQAREAGVGAERQRMAREIHDTLAQGLTGIITQLQAARQATAGLRPGPGQPDWQHHLDTAAQLARDSLAEARRSVSAMRPRLLDEAKLPDALAETATRWSAIHDVKTEVTTTGEARPLHPELEVTLLRVAQEALANVAKHASAARVALTLSYMEDVVTLDVRDDGRGFAPGGPAPGGPGGFGLSGFGLTGMRQRLGNVAGTLAIESEPGSGTAISASVPAIGASAAGD